MMIKKVNQFFTMSRLLVFYWAMFWLMNGLDKFLNRTDVGIFTWHGKDRSEQFGGYFSNTDLPESWTQCLLYFTGIWELVLFFPLAIVLWIQVFHKRLDEAWFKLGMFWGGASFVAFAFFDVIFGDRSELLEHSTFLILIVVSSRLVLGDRKFNDYLEAL